MNGSMPLKSTQGFFGNSSAFPRTGKLLQWFSTVPTANNTIVPKYGCVVMEVEDWIGGINYP